ncbi:hypothetical protein M0R01_04490 [bacterium]|jgi:hypothetical protein|nr:hypothetical protein [bacterium]
MREDFIFPLFGDDIIITDKDFENLGDVLTIEQANEFIKEEFDKLKDDATWQFARDNFQNEDESPWEMSPGELAIFKLILFRQYPRSQIIASTQYGKSLTISRALLTRITTFPGDWMLVVPDTKRGRILINYMIRDTANNNFFARKLSGINIKEKNLLMRLLEEKSKVKLTYSIMEEDQIPRYGTIEIITADARRKQNTITTIMGFGGRNIVADEAALEDDDVDSGIFRMLAGKGEDTFLVNIGNPFFRNHFLTTWKDPNYKKVFIDYKIGMAEGRYLPSVIEEAKKKANFEVLFACKFPPADAIDSDNYQQLISDEEVKLAMQGGVHFGENRLGIDPADGGEDDASIVHRSSGYAEILFNQKGLDQMDFTGQCSNKLKETNIKKVYVDSVQIGTYSRLVEINRVDNVKPEQKWNLFGVKGNETPGDPRQFLNKRAEMYWRLRSWIKQGGKLSKDPIWLQLTTIKYKNVDSKGVIAIMPKDEMRKRKIASPGAADALAATFYDPQTAIAITQEERFFMRKMAQQKKHKTPSGGYNLKMTGH